MAYIPLSVPSSIFPDYFAKGKIYSSKIRKYSTTIGVLWITLTGYLFLDFLELGTEFAFAIIGFLFLLVFLPELFLIALWFGS